MKIDADSNTQSTVYEATPENSVNSVVGKDIAANDSKTRMPTDTVTLSDAATKLASELSDLAAAIAAMPVPERPQPELQSQSARRKKSKNSGLSPMLDVDAFRLIRDKLRSNNLGLREPGLMKDTLQEATKI